MVNAKQRRYAQRHGVPTGLASVLFSWKKKLDVAQVGYGGRNLNLQMGMPFKVHSEDVEALVAKGEVFVTMLRTANELYRDSFDGSFVWKLAEGGLTTRAVAYQRKLYETRDVPLPAFFRADMLSLDKAVELNIPGGGLGLMEAVSQVCPSASRFGNGLARSWANGLKELTGKDHPRVYLPIHNNNVVGSVNYFVKMLGKCGIFVGTYRTNNALPSPKDADVVFRFGLNRSVKMSGWDALFDAYLTGDVVIEPAPVSLYDSKISELLAFHPATSYAFPDTVRDAFPQTWLATADNEVTVGVNGNKRIVGVDELASLSAGERRFVLKYAGADDALRCAGHAVYQLDGKRRGRHGAEDVLLSALLDWDSKSDPWILQERLRAPFDVTYFDNKARALVTESLRARIMPCYRVLGDKVELIAGSALFNKNWKVHGNPQSVFCPMIAYG